MRKFLLTALLATAAFGFVAVRPASAQWPGRVYSGYGNGMHDTLPHWHQTLTPFGPTYWYGNGLHDYLPHHHTESPYGGVRSYSMTPFGPTKSYNGYPYGGGLYGGGYYPYGGGYYRNWGW